MKMVVFILYAIFIKMYYFLCFISKKIYFLTKQEKITFNISKSVIKWLKEVVICIQQYHIVLIKMN